MLKLTHVSRHTRPADRPIWVGIDEAGYGPNLGPMVTAAVALVQPGHACSSAQSFDEADGQLRNAQRAFGERWSESSLRSAPKSIAKGYTELLIDDSKRVHKGTYGFDRLEFSCLSLWPGELPDTYAGWLRLGGPSSRIDPSKLTRQDMTRQDIGQEDTLDQKILSALNHPVVCSEKHLYLQHARSIIGSLRRKGLMPKLQVCYRVILPKECNEIFATTANKSHLNELGFVEVCRKLGLNGAGNKERSSAQPSNSFHILCDRHGGRLYYKPLLASVWQEGHRIKDELEDRSGCVYRINSTSSVQFVAKADQLSALTALASMYAKYIREVYMRGFNALFQELIPGIKPTAGYPADAKRFFHHIQGCVSGPQRLFAKDHLWRER